jgi:hypothetical protein
MNSSAEAHFVRRADASAKLHSFTGERPAANMARAFHIVGMIWLKTFLHDNPYATTLARQPLRNNPYATTRTRQPVRDNPCTTTLSRQPLRDNPFTTTLSRQPLRDNPCPTTLARQPMVGCPILRALCEGWDKQNVRGKGLG